MLAWQHFYQSVQSPTRVLTHIQEDESRFFLGVQPLELRLSSQLAYAPSSRLGTCCTQTEQGLEQH